MLHKRKRSSRSNNLTRLHSRNSSRRDLVRVHLQLRMRLTFSAFDHVYELAASQFVIEPFNSRLSCVTSSIIRREIVCS